MVQIDAAICFANEVDLTQVFLEAGQLIAGALGIVPREEVGGIITFGTRLPLAVIDSSNLMMLHLYIYVLAGAADQLEQRLGVPSIDRF